jgi:hypothetical protein
VDQAWSGISFDGGEPCLGMDRASQRFLTGGRVAPVFVLAAAVIGFAASTDSSGPAASASAQRHRSLEFGIYPGGAVGTVGPAGAVRPEVAELRLAGLRTLRGGGRPFVVHLYDSYMEPADRDAVPWWLTSEIAAYTAESFKLELVLTYRPKRPAGDVAGFARFVRARVRQIGVDLSYLQVTNEANVAGAPAAADGAYRGARAALVRGVIAARDEARRRGLHHLRIGFNWAYQLGRSERAFFASLWRRGGRRFANAVDWVGLNSYPGTWGPALGAGDLGSGVRSSTLAAIRILREDLLPRAHLGAADLHVTESGYPTGAGRSEAMQEEALRAAVNAVADVAERQRVTGYRWFDLRDADSGGPSFESRYGLMRDDYSPKPAFGAYRELIARLG